MIFKFLRRSYRTQIAASQLTEQLTALGLPSVKSLPPTTVENFAILAAATQHIGYEEGEKEAFLKQPDALEITNDLIELWTQLQGWGTDLTASQLAQAWEMYIELDEEIVMLWLNAYIDSTNRRLLRRAHMDGNLLTPEERERLKDPADPLP